MLTESVNVKRSCNCPNYYDLFSHDAGGFPTGIDIIHCSYHTMHSPWFGDVTILDNDGRQLSYILTKERCTRSKRIVVLSDNSKNIKIRKHEKRDSPRKIEECPY